MKHAILVTFFLLVGSSCWAASIGGYENCYRQRAANIPSVEEREFLDSYIEYLKVGSKTKGEMAISKMQALAKKAGGRFNVQWVSIFEGSHELCCGGPQSCYESLGSTSLKFLYPRIEKGWVTATFLVLMYYRLANSDGADFSGLSDYMKVIREKHPWAIVMFNKKYPPEG